MAVVGGLGAPTPNPLTTAARTEIGLRWLRTGPGLRPPHPS